MGFRTTVVLYNDQSSTWSKDAQLGEKIQHAMNFAMGQRNRQETNLHYGRVVECAHADQQTLALFDGYDMTPLSYSNWYPGATQDVVALELLKRAAAKYGYTLHKKPQT